MNYYNTVGELNDKIGKFSFITMVLAIATLGLTIVDSPLFIVTFVAFAIVFIISTVNKYKLNKLQQSIFDEYAKLIVNAFGFDEASKIKLNQFFTAKATGSRMKMMAIYDAKLDLDNKQYIKLLIAIEKNGLQEYTNNELLSKDFDMASYVKVKIKQA